MNKENGGNFFQRTARSIREHPRRIILAGVLIAGGAAGGDIAIKAAVNERNLRGQITQLEADPAISFIDKQIRADQLEQQRASEAGKVLVISLALVSTGMVAYTARPRKREYIPPAVTPQGSDLWGSR